MIPLDERLRSERAHGEMIASQAEEIWHWRGPAGVHRWQRRADFLLHALAQHRPTTILEIGSGTGLLTQSLLNRLEGRLAYLCSDISLPLLHQARNREYRREHTVQFLINNAYHNALKDNSIDAVVAISVLHHLDLPQALKEFRRVLKPHGVAVFSEPNYLNPHIFLERSLPCLRKRFGVSPHETAFVRWRLRDDLQRAGFRNITIAPFDFVYPYVRSQGIVAKLVALERVLEKTPLIREVAGSLFISFQK